MPSFFFFKAFLLQCRISRHLKHYTSDSVVIITCLYCSLVWMLQVNCVRFLEKDLAGWQLGRLG